MAGRGQLDWIIRGLLNLVCGGRGYVHVCICVLTVVYMRLVKYFRPYLIAMSMYLRFSPLSELLPRDLGSQMPPCLANLQKAGNVQGVGDVD
jgi:hypothetical protein